jgi:formate-dependent nitrite reductase cytochrome c552 subunit
MTETNPQPTPKRRILPFVLIVLVTAALTFGVAWLLTNIFQHKIEAQNPYIRFVDVNDNTTDPEQWGKNWPREYDGYLRTAEVTSTHFGGSESAPPDSRLQKDPWLKPMFAGYATDQQLAPIFVLQRKAQWRLDFVNAENSMGFHAPQEAVKILGEATDYARQGQIQAIKISH